jgi:hypothetical protein
MRAEALRFVKAVALEGNGTVSALLTSRFGFVDQGLAKLYGLSGTFGSELVRVEHAPESGRLGLFTQGAFLAGHSSSSSGTSPILRGVFLLRRVACADIPDPPAGAVMLEPETPSATELRTTRDYFTWKTSMSACAGCHGLINPTGFAFERFDGLGQWRDDERGAPLDTSGTLRLGSNDLPFSDASGLLEALAKEPLVQACYANLPMAAAKMPQTCAPSAWRHSGFKPETSRFAISRWRSPSGQRSTTFRVRRSS